MLNRREFSSKFAAGLLSFSLSGSLFAQSTYTSEDALNWHNVEDWGVEGRGWTSTQRYFDRLPAKAEGMVREKVWDLSRHSAGMAVRFFTDSPLIQVRYKLLSERLAMFHMPATGVSGIDLYAEDAQGNSRWVSVTRPTKQELDQAIAKDLVAGKRLYTMYLPLYNGVEYLEIGIEKGYSFEPLTPRLEPPILFYGTSIMHGACASRPGMAIPAILGRRFRRPTMNFGFSGNGKMEKELAELLSELNPCVFALDCIPNMNATGINERTGNFVKILRSAHPKTPILVVEDRRFTNSMFFPTRKDRHDSNREALRKVYRELLDAGIEDLYYLSGEQLLGLDGEATTDGSHPNDLGMVRYADAYESVLRAILKQY